MVRKLGRFPTRVLPHRSGLATARKAVVPPCMPVGVLWHLPADPSAPSDVPRYGEHVGAHPVAGDLTADEFRSLEVLSLSVTLTSGVRGPLSVARGPRRVEIWVSLVFFIPVLNWFSENDFQKIV